MKGCNKVTHGNGEFGTMNCGDTWGKWVNKKWVENDKPTLCSECLLLTERSKE